MSRTAAHNQGDDKDPDFRRHHNFLDDYKNKIKSRKCCKNHPIEEIEETTEIFTIRPSEIESDNNQQTRHQDTDDEIFTTVYKNPKAERNNDEDFVNELQQKFNKTQKIPNRQTQRKTFKYGISRNEEDKMDEAAATFSGYSESPYKKKFEAIETSDLDRRSNEIGEPNKIDLSKYQSNQTLKFSTQNKDDPLNKYLFTDEASSLKRAKGLINELVDKELKRIHGQSETDIYHCQRQEQQDRFQIPCEPLKKAEYPGKIRHLRKKGLDIICEEIKKLKVLEDVED